MQKSRRSEKAVAVVRQPRASGCEDTTTDHPDTSMLGFYINRANRCLSASDRAALEKAKAALMARPDPARSDKTPK